MRKLLLLLALLMGTCLTTVHADSIELVPSYQDSTRMDTVVTSELQDADDDYDTAGFTGPDTIGWHDDSLTSVAIVAIIICCGLPFFIVAIVLWFRYKNKQAKYKLAAEALAAGQSIPAELFQDSTHHGNPILVKGIRNVFLGIGLGVFFWLLTEEEGLAAIGFLIFCMGLGQVLIAYATTPRKKNENHTDTPHNDR